MDDEYQSDTVYISESSSVSTDLYPTEAINQFLDETFKKSVKVEDYFQRPPGRKKKRFCLKKHITTLRKSSNKTIRIKK